jgi:hypothetical protein
LRPKATPQIVHAARIRARHQGAHVDLKAAIAALERADSGGADNTVLVPLRQAVRGAREALQVVRDEATTAGVFKPEKTPQIKVQQRVERSENRLKAAIAAIRAGGYTKATQERLIEKARAVEEKRLYVADMLTHHPACVSGKGWVDD